MPDTGSESRSGIGARLRAGRERMGLTQLQMSEKLHVDPKVVESLEAERFDALGAPVFVRGHLKRYADLIGEEAAQLVGQYNTATQPALPDLTRLPKASPEAAPGRLAVPALLVLIAFVMLGVVWWIMESVSGPPGEAGAAPVAREIPLEPVIDEPLPLDAGESAMEPSASEGDASSPVAEASRAQPASVTQAGSAASGTSAASSAASRTPSASATSQATPAGRPMQMTMRFASDSWVEVYDANGERLFYDIGSADSQRTVSGTPPFRVTFGNAPGVTFDVNGQAATLPASTLRGETAHFVINRSGRIARPQPQSLPPAPTNAPANGQGN